MKTKCVRSDIETSSPDILSQLMMTEHTYDKIDLYNAICRTTSSYDFVRFTYTDIYGISRSKTVCKSGLEKFLTGGIGVHVGKFYFGICVAIGRLHILRIVWLSWGLCIMCGTGSDQWLE